MDAINNLIKEGTASTEAYFVTKDEVLIPYYFTGRRIEFDGKTCIIGVGLDITERKIAEEHAFALALEKEQMRILATFIQDASHEFRTPLSIIQTSLYFLTKTPDPILIQEKATQIESQIKRLTQLLEKLVIMSKLDSGVDFVKTALNLKWTIEQVINQLQENITAKNLNLQTNLETSDSPQADEENIYQAMKEVIGNAIRYVPDEGFVHLNMYKAENEMIVEIKNSVESDNRIDISRLFERFYRVDSAHTTPGFGLGLPIAQKIIEGHQGQIEVEQQENIFVCRITLPFDGDTV